MSVEPPLVLCVDDDLRTLDILKKVLARLPVRAAVAAEPAVGIELAGELRPDLLILDLMMPGQSGWEVLEAIRRQPQAAGMRVLILSARDNGAERLLAFNVAQVDAFMGKPFDIVELARRVLALLNLPADQAWLAPSDLSTEVEPHG